MYMALLLLMQWMQKKFQQGSALKSQKGSAVSRGTLSRTFHDKCTKIYSPMSQENGLNHSYMQLLKKI